MQPQLGIWNRFIGNLLGVDRCSLSWGSGKGLAVWVFQLIYAPNWKYLNMTLKLFNHYSTYQRGGASLRSYKLSK